MSWGEFTRLGYLIGLHELEVARLLEPFRVDVFDPVSFDDFVLYYFDIMSSMDDIASQYRL